MTMTKRVIWGFLSMWLLSSLSCVQGKAFTLGIRDSFMIAHSFHQHAAFGPAGGLHGATYVGDY